MRDIGPLALHYGTGFTLMWDRTLSPPKICLPNMSLVQTGENTVATCMYSVDTGSDVNANTLCVKSSLFTFLSTTLSTHCREGSPVLPRKGMCVLWF